MKKILLTLALSLGISAFATSYEVVDLFANPPFDLITHDPGEEIIAKARNGRALVIDNHNDVICTTQSHVHVHEHQRKHPFYHDLPSRDRGWLVDRHYRWNKRTGFSVLCLSGFFTILGSNDQAQVIGADFCHYHASLLDPHKGSISLDVDESWKTTPIAINNNGTILGKISESSALWDGEEWILLDQDTLFTSLNDYNELAGIKEKEGVVLLKEDNIHFLSLPNAEKVVTIQNSGDVLIKLAEGEGYLIWETRTDHPLMQLTFDIPPGNLVATNKHGQLLSAEEGLYDRQGSHCTSAELAKIVKAHRSFFLANKITFTDINDNGWIVGNAEMENNSPRPFLLKPVTQ